MFEIWEAINLEKAVNINWVSCWRKVYRKTSLIHISVVSFFEKASGIINATCCVRYLQSQLSSDIYMSKTRFSTLNYFKTNQFAAHSYYLEICTNAFLSDRVYVEYKRPYIMNFRCFKRSHIIYQGELCLAI